MRWLVAIDLEDRPEGVVERVVPWARRLGAAVDLAYASRFSLEGLPAAPQTGDEEQLLFGEWAGRARADRDRLERLQADLPEAVRGAGPAFLTGPPSEAIAEAAAPYDLVVVAHHQRAGLPRLVAGSVSARIARTSPAPVLVLGLGDPIPDPEEALYVLAPVDGSDPGALPWIARHLPLHRTEVVHVRPDDGPIWMPGPTPTPAAPRNRAAVEAAIRARTDASGLPGVGIHVLDPGGHPGDRVASLAKELGVDLIVMPTHGRRGLSRLWMGSVAERVVDRAHTAVLVVPWAERG